MKYTKNQKHFAAGVHPLLWRSWAILAAAALSLSLALAPLSVEAKDNNKDKNKDKKKKEEIYSESIYDSDGLEDYIAELAYNKKQPIQTNQVKGWPKGPVIGAAGAIIILSLLKSLPGTLSGIQSVLADDGIDTADIAILLKVMGICFVTEFT